MKKVGQRAATPDPDHPATDRAMNDFTKQIAAMASVPMSRRCPQRITITVPWQTHQRLLERSQQEGRSLSNLAAHILELGITQ